MLSKEESEFIEYWEANRLKRKKGFRRLALGIPLALIMVVAILANFLSGWYRRADMDIKSQGSLILVVLFAVLLIVIFTTVFSAYHKWDINEQRYRELKAKKDVA
jgi:membrane protein YdbS with pleckstrin-like domain